MHQHIAIDLRDYERVRAWLVRIYEASGVYAGTDHLLSAILKALAKAEVRTINEIELDVIRYAGACRDRALRRQRIRTEGACRDNADLKQLIKKMEQHLTEYRHDRAYLTPAQRREKLRERIVANVCHYGNKRVDRGESHRPSQADAGATAMHACGSPTDTKDMKERL